MGPRRSFHLFLALVSSVAVPWATGVWGLVPRFDFVELSRKSRRIVTGEVVSIRPRAGEFPGGGPVLFTEVALRVERVLTGGPCPEELRIEILGGRSGSRFMTCPDSPAYALGEEVLVFLREDAEKYWNTGWRQGKYSLVKKGSLVRGSRGLPIPEDTPLRDVEARIQLLSHVPPGDLRDILEWIGEPGPKGTPRGGYPNGQGATDCEVIAEWPGGLADLSVNPCFPDEILSGSPEQQLDVLGCAARAWHDQTLADFEFVWKGASTKGGFDLDDGINNLSWVEVDGGEVLATTILAGYGGTVTAFDIVFFASTGGVPNRWSGPGEPATGDLDLQGIATHELGHALGLAHIADGQATMSIEAGGSGLFRRTPAAADRACIESLYGLRPGSGPAVEILSVSPSSGWTLGGNVVAIEGSNFTFDSDTRVSIGGTPLVDSLWIVESCCRLRILGMPPHGAGPVDIAISNSLGSATAAAGYLYVEPPPPPILRSIYPAEGPTAGGIRVILVGRNFTREAVVRFGARIVWDTLLINSTAIRGTLPPALRPGPMDVKIEQGEFSAVLPSGFTYFEIPAPVPVLLSVEPAEGPTTGRSPVTVRGENFTTQAVLFLGESPLLSQVFLDATRIDGLTPPSTEAGTRDVRLVQGEDVAILPDAFTYYVPPPKAPVLRSVIPGEGPTTGGILVTVVGANLVPEAVVYVGESPLGQRVFINSTAIRGVLPPGSGPGPVDVRVVQGGDMAVLPGGFTYVEPPPLVPAIRSIEPTEGPTSGGTPVAVTGEDFAVDAIVSIGGIQISAQVFVDSTRIEGLAPPASGPGPADVRVAQGDGEAVLPGGFTYYEPPPATPVIRSVDPEAGPTTGGIKVRVLGANFVEGAAVFFGDKGLLSAVLVNSTAIDGTLPPASGPGTVDVRVVQGSGEAVLPGGFTYELYSIRAEDAQTQAGEELVRVTLEVTSPRPLSAISLAVTYDPESLTLLDLSREGTPAEEAVPELEVFDDESGRSVLSFLLETPAGGLPFPPGDAVPLGDLVFAVSQEAPWGIPLDVRLLEVLDDPAGGTSFAIAGGQRLVPVLEDGSVLVLAPPFLRGDSNGDGEADVADAIHLLLALFVDRPLPRCRDSADANDDGAVDISDPIDLLEYLFRGGDPPPAPFPIPGPDPTEDALPCR